MSSEWEMKSFDVTGHYGKKDANPFWGYVILGFFVLGCIGSCSEKNKAKSEPVHAAGR